jgi:hypothetical protein
MEFIVLEKLNFMCREEFRWTESNFSFGCVIWFCRRSCCWDQSRPSPGLHAHWDQPLRSHQPSCHVRRLSFLSLWSMIYEVSNALQSLQLEKVELSVVKTEKIVLVSDFSVFRLSDKITVRFLVFSTNFLW